MILKFQMLEHIAVNLREVMKDKRKKVEFEERLRISLMNAFNVNPDDYNVDLVYNRTADCFDIVLRKNDKV